MQRQELTRFVERRKRVARLRVPVGIDRSQLCGAPAESRRQRIGISRVVVPDLPHVGDAHAVVERTVEGHREPPLEHVEAADPPLAQLGEDVVHPLGRSGPDEKAHHVGAARREGTSHRIPHRAVAGHRVDQRIAAVPDHDVETGVCDRQRPPVGAHGACRTADGGTRPDLRDHARAAIERGESRALGPAHPRELRRHAEQRSAWSTGDGLGDESLEELDVLARWPQRRPDELPLARVLVPVVAAHARSILGIHRRRRAPTGSSARRAASNCSTNQCFAGSWAGV